MRNEKQFKKKIYKYTKKNIYNKKKTIKNKLITSIKNQNSSVISSYL